ncbi:hypothetical protein QQ054_32695 [Oscillatoria amoena NRMC-F 0135]|nr:hypothetical protein [Oscillatoria amoena NRMC-F 0135]
MNFFRNFRVLIPSLLLLPAAFGQSQWVAPRLTAVFDKTSHSLQPVYGHPGSAYLGAALRDNLRNAYPSLDGQWAVVAGEDGAEIIYLNSPEEPVLKLAPGLQDVAWSADSKSFAAQFCLPAGEEVPDSSLPPNCYFAAIHLSDGHWAEVGASPPASGPGRLLAYRSSTREIWFTRRDNSGENPELVFFRCTDSQTVSVKQGLDALSISFTPCQGLCLWGTDAVAGQIFRLEQAEGGWRQLAAPITAPEGYRSSHLLGLSREFLLSVWVPVSLEEDNPLPALLLRHAISEESGGEAVERHELEAIPDALFRILPGGFISLQRTVDSGQPLFLYDEQGHQLFFVPALSPAAEVKAAVAGGAQ